MEARKHDDGIFWISWEDVLVYFGTLHLSWNPDLFHRRITHQLWPADRGPESDRFNVGENPQFILSMSKEAVESKSSLWILLSRHVTKQEQEGDEVEDYVTAHIYRAKHEKDRIWYPGGKRHLVSGAYTNNPHGKREILFI